MGKRGYFGGISCGIGFGLGEALSGGISTSIAGGDFWHGFGVSATVGLVNHAAHNGLFGGSDPVEGLPDGRKLWDLSAEEFALFHSPEGRRFLFGGDYDIQLSVRERLYYFGKLLTFVSPSSKVTTLYRADDFIRYSNKTLVSNQIIKGPGATGAKRIPAIKGGGTNPVTGRSLPYHFHIHQYNWNTPGLWFKQTPILKP